MNDKSALLDQLRIDRSAAPDIAPRGRGPLWIIIAVLSLALGVLGWRLYSADGEAASPVVAVAAPVASTAAPAASASLLDASGYVVARRAATVSATIPGRVVEVLIDEGSRVEKGQVVAKLDDSAYLLDLARSRAQLEQDKAQLASAQVTLAGALPIYQRTEKQLAGGYASGQEFDNAKARVDELRANVEVASRRIEVAQSAVATAERNLRETVVRAPFTGVITYQGAQPGEIVSPTAAGGGFTRTGIGTIVDMDSLEVEVDVSENFINRVMPGGPATVRLNAYPDWEIPATVIAVIPTAERAKATVKVRIGFKQRDPRILPEMGARVSFQAAPDTIR